MSRDHDAAIRLLADLLGLSASPSRADLDPGEHWSYWREEEAAALSLTAYAKAAGVDLVELARERSARLIRQFA